MPNPTGRAAKRAPSKAAEKPATGAPKERHVRSPFERAEANQAKAKDRLDKAKAKLADFETSRAKLAADVELAQAEFDYANMHPLLVRARKESGEGGDPSEAFAQNAGREPGVLATGPETEGRMQVVEIGDSPPQFDNGESIRSSVPPGEGEGDDEGDEDDVDAAEAGEEEGANITAPPFDFAKALGENRDPFGPDEGESGVNGSNVTRV